MPALAALVLQNAAAANVTFNPVSIDSDGVAKWQTADSVYDARSHVTHKVRLPLAGGSVARVKQRITIPVMDSVDASKKIGECYVDVEAVMHKQASETIRLNLQAYAETLIAHAITTAAVQNLESVY